MASVVDRQKCALDSVSAPCVADGELDWQVAFLPGRKTPVQTHPRGWKEHASHLRKRADSVDAHARVTTIHKRNIEHHYAFSLAAGFSLISIGITAIALSEHPRTNYPSSTHNR